MTHRAPTVLVTGFAPFAGETINPSQLIAQELDGTTIAGHRIVGAILPTEFATSLASLQNLLEQHQPAAVLALGQAGGRAEISLERVAVNLIDARIPDNAGAQPVDVAVVENAPNAYFSTLPLKAMLAALHAEGIPAALSHSAGTFVCNQCFFGLLHLLESHTVSTAGAARGGFVHVPYLPEQAARHADAPSMTLSTMVQAVQRCLHVALNTSDDMHYAAGTTH